MSSGSRGVNLSGSRTSCWKGFCYDVMIHDVMIYLYFYEQMTMNDLHMSAISPVG
jgi:hypothetical protein